MILVTLGTQKQQFKRLLDYIENSNINDKIIVQAGYTVYNSKKMEILDFVNYEKMEKLIDEADLVITHGGTGSILSPLKKGKKVIACPRLSKYDEHVDNHQEEIVDIFSDEKYILKLDENTDFQKLVDQSKKFQPRKYKSNTQKFIKNLKEIIEK